jgi:hypothetical protein
MTTAFDAQKALREELQGLADVRQTFVLQERTAEDAMAKAEMAYNAAVKMRGFVDSQIAEKRAKLNALVEAASRGG